jgi:hypothetical protein
MLVVMAELIALPAEMKRQTGDVNTPYRAFGVLLPYREKRDTTICR